jgi:hypothetical protein
MTSIETSFVDSVAYSNSNTSVRYWFDIVDFNLMEPVILAIMEVAQLGIGIPASGARGFRTGLLPLIPVPDGGSSIGIFSFQ